MKKVIIISLILPFVILATSCNQSTCDRSSSTNQKLVSEVMTKEVQDATAPDKVLDDLMEGNDRYVKDSLTQRDFPAQVKATSNRPISKSCNTGLY